ncbi:Uncharacterised protein [Mycobacteroides abscessus subsp. abscessus]|nr:Uncharacterised protein [Mycobacteroides abscessus subsp. abscessus]
MPSYSRLMSTVVYFVYGVGVPVFCSVLRPLSGCCGLPSNTKYMSDAAGEVALPA